MATTLNSSRQPPLIALIELDITTVETGNAVEVKLPPNAYTTRTVATVVTAFNTAGTGTATVTLTDGTLVYINAQNAKASAGTAVTVAADKKFYPTGGTLTAYIDETLDTTAATAGRLLIAVEYVILGRHSENQF